MKVGIPRGGIAVKKHASGLVLLGVGIVTLSVMLRNDPKCKGACQIAAKDAERFGLNKILKGLFAA
jgi:hypothetical protein